MMVKLELGDHPLIISPTELVGNTQFFKHSNIVLLSNVTFLTRSSVVFQVYQNDIANQVDYLPKTPINLLRRHFFHPQNTRLSFVVPLRELSHQGEKNRKVNEFLYPGCLLHNS